MPINGEDFLRAFYRLFYLQFCDLSDLWEKTLCSKGFTSNLRDILKWTYLKERNCLRNKFSRVLRIFGKFDKLNPRQKSTGSQFVGNVFGFCCCCCCFFSFFSFTLGSLSINDGHVKNILQDIKQCEQRQHRKENANLFMIFTLFDLLLGIQSRIKSFISK